MRERPILFSGPMVRAILSGQKTQTRRIIKQATGPSLSVNMDDETGAAELSWLYGDGPGYEVHEAIKRVVCPYGRPGDRLWVRETWADDVEAQWEPQKRGTFYRADDDSDAIKADCLDCGIPFAWRPSIHMPRWRSRILLEITGVRVQRLQDINEADAQAEGCALECMTPTGDDSGSAIYGPGGFLALWESINGPGSWNANPWVWVVEFRRVES